MGRGSLAHTPTVAVSCGARKIGSSHRDNECGRAAAGLLLYQHFVGAVLVAKPPPFDAPLDPAMPVTRYRVEHRAWCPPEGRRSSRSAKQNSEFIAELAAGDCLVVEPATLGAADAIVLYQDVERLSLSTYKTVHEGAIAERIGVYSRDGSGWRKLSQKTSVGGYDWFVPMMVGLIDRSPLNSFRPQDNIGFVRLNGAEPERLDPDLNTRELGLRGSATDARRSATIRNCPAGSWPTPRSRPLPRRCSFSPHIRGSTAGRQPILILLQRSFATAGRLVSTAAPETRRRSRRRGQPIHRIPATDPSSPVDPTDRKGNRHAIDVLAQVFALLPPCTAAPFHDDLRRLAADEARRHYVTSMLLRIADAVPNCDPSAKPR